MAGTPTTLEASLRATQLKAQAASGVLQGLTNPDIGPLEAPLTVVNRNSDGVARPHVIDADLEEGYRAMAADEVREAEADDWTESLVGDVVDETR